MANFAKIQYGKISQNFAQVKFYVKILAFLKCNAGKNDHFQQIAKLINVAANMLHVEEKEKKSPFQWFNVGIFNHRLSPVI